MKVIFTFTFLAALIFLIPKSQAQGVIQQFGSLFAGDNIMSQGNNRAVDAGNSSVPTLPGTRPVGVGVINSGFGFCQWNPDPGANTIFSTFCTGFNSNGNGLIYFNSPSGKGLQFVINGTSYPFPGTPVNITGYAVVANNAALKALIVAPGSQVYRQGFYAAGDGGAAPYTFSATACSINSGSGDNGLQVEPTSASGCWNANLPLSGASPRIWGALGNGTTDDTSFVQAAASALASVNIPLLTSDGLYLMHAGLTYAASTPSPVVLGNGVGDLGFYGGCAAGFLFDADTTGILINTVTATVQGNCLEMSTTPATRLSGAGIDIGATSTTQESDAQISNNTIFNSYNCIVNGGPTTGPTQTNGNKFIDNACRDASHIAISEGLVSTNRSTVGTTYKNNKLGCFTSCGSSIGFQANDSAFSYDGTDNGPYAFNVCMAYYPGAGQTIIGTLTGVVADSCITTGVDFNPGTSGGIGDLRFVNAWVAGGPIHFAVTGAGTYRAIRFIGSSIQASTTPVIDIEGGTNITFADNQICSQNTTSGDAIKINSNGTGSAGTINILGNQLSNCFGNFTDGIHLIGGGPGTGIWNIQGNNFDGIAEPILYTPSGETAIIANNMGVDNLDPTITNAPQITIPPGVNIVRLMGTGTITDIINSMYSGRIVPFQMIVVNGATFATTGSSQTKFCGFSGPYTYAAGVVVSVSYDTGDGCWAHNP